MVFAFVEKDAIEVRVCIDDDTWKTEGQSGSVWSVGERNWGLENSHKSPSNEDRAWPTSLNDCCTGLSGDGFDAHARMKLEPPSTPISSEAAAEGEEKREGDRLSQAEVLRTSADGTIG